MFEQAYTHDRFLAVLYLDRKKLTLQGPTAGYAREHGSAHLLEPRRQRHYPKPQPLYKRVSPQLPYQTVKECCVHFEHSVASCRAAVMAAHAGTTTRQ
jgi:hypothetical protein